MAERSYFGTDGIRGRANSHPMTAEVVTGGTAATSPILPARPGAGRTGAPGGSS